MEISKNKDMALKNLGVLIITVASEFDQNNNDFYRFCALKKFK